MATISFIKDYILVFSRLYLKSLAIIYGLVDWALWSYGLVTISLVNYIVCSSNCPVTCDKS